MVTSVLTVNNRRYVKYIIPLCTFLEFHTHLEGNSARSFENSFRICSRALNMMNVFDECHHFSDYWTD